MMTGHTDTLIHYIRSDVVELRKEVKALTIAVTKHKVYWAVANAITALTIPTVVSAVAYAVIKAKLCG